MRTERGLSLPKTLGALALATAVLLPARGAQSEDPPPLDKAPATPQVVELTVDPAPEPRPALKHHLLPPAEVLRPGNAAPIYLRLVHEKRDQTRDALFIETERLLERPAEEFPLEEAEKHVNGFPSLLAELSSAALKEDCDWEYVLEGRDPLMILLPDATSVRGYGRLLTLKARVAARRGDVPQALAALHDGFALARHASKAPFTINLLVANAMGLALLREIDDVIQQPGAPNLYWALAELPRPLIALQGGFPIERQLLLLSFPKLQNPDSLPSADWERLAAGLRTMAQELARDSEPAQASQQTTGATRPVEPQGPVGPEKLAEARAYLRDVLQLPAAEVEDMTEAEVEVRYTVALYRDMVDQAAKWFLLPTALSLPEITARTEAVKAETRRRELYRIVSLLVPAGNTLLGAQARVERRVVRLQVIEALRMHAAATGKLPDSLDEVKVVPVPSDPGTGQAFDYRLDGDAAVLDIAELPEAEREWVSLPVRIRLRQK